MLAAITSVIARMSVRSSAWPSASQPASDEMAGPRLIITANVDVGRRRSARSSRLYGTTDDSAATTTPSTAATGSSSRVPPSTRPSGSTMSAATVIDSASPSVRAKRPPTRRLSTMYAAHIAPATIANATPAGLSRPAPFWPSTTTPAIARPAHSQAAARRPLHTASVSGPKTSSVTARPSGMVWIE